MSKPLITINEKSTLQDALHIMRDNNVQKTSSSFKKEPSNGNDIAINHCKCD